MHSAIALTAVGLALALMAAGAGAQLVPGDIVLTGVDTAAAGGVTLRLDPVSGAVTTLIPKLAKPRDTWAGNWVEMAPDNREVWVAHEDGALKGAVFVLDGAGRITSIRPVPWRVDCFRFRSAGGITWSGLGGYLTDRLVLTDAEFGSWWAFASNLPSASLCHQEIEEDGLFAVSFQAVSPKGGIATVDPFIGKTVRTLTGLGMVNTIDYDSAGDVVHAVEFGTPANPSAQAGALLEVDLAAPKVTTLIAASSAGGLAVDRLNWIHRRTDGTLLLGARHRVFVFDLATRKIVKTWTVAPDRGFALTGGTVYGSRMVRLDTTGGTRPGDTIVVHVCYPHVSAAGATYRLACSTALRPGIQLGAETLDLSPDAVFAICVLGWIPTVFQDFSGFLDSTGAATARFNVPDIPGLTNVRFFIGGVVMIGNAFHVTNVEGVTITK